MKGPLDPPSAYATRLVAKRFSIMQKLTTGEPAELYVARDRYLDRVVGLQLLHANVNYDPVAAKLLEREARLLARIDHPNVAGVLDFGALGTELCLLLEPVGRRDLGEWIAQEHPDHRARVRALAAAARGLAAAHAAGVVHGALQPARVRVDERGHVRVVGFARARDLAPEPGAWEHDDPPSTDAPDYAAPELGDSHLDDPLSDQYAFCVLAWEALSGRRPPNDPTREASSPALRREAAYRVLARGLCPRPTQRWSDMDQLASALARASSRRRRLFAALDYRSR